MSRTMRIEVNATVSDSDDEQEAADLARVQEVANRIAAIINEPKYADLMLSVDGPTNWG